MPQCLFHRVFRLVGCQHCHGHRHFTAIVTVTITATVTPIATPSATPTAITDGERVFPTVEEACHGVQPTQRAGSLAGAAGPLTGRHVAHTAYLIGEWCGLPGLVGVPPVPPARVALGGQAWGELRCPSHGRAVLALAMTKTVSVSATAVAQCLADKDGGAASVSATRGLGGGAIFVKDSTAMAAQQRIMRESFPSFSSQHVNPICSLCHGGETLII